MLEERIMSFNIGDWVLVKVNDGKEPSELRGQIVGVEGSRRQRVYHVEVDSPALQAPVLFAIEEDLTLLPSPESK